MEKTSARQIFQAQFALLHKKIALFGIVSLFWAYAMSFVEGFLLILQKNSIL
ncbi:MAG: hypothetical protein KBT10_08575 [Bacteroidales bacterium]|nr:hypothetical protein [Candidatus Sodaliphilus aphodohippi]